MPILLIYICIFINNWFYSSFNCFFNSFAIFSLIPFTAQCKSLEKDIFRLHILANSDSESDQELKLKVRDKVLSYTEDLYKDCETKEDTVKVTENNLVNILNVAQKEVYNLGYNYKVKGEITNMYFNTRQYGKFTALQQLSVDIKRKTFPVMLSYDSF